MNEQKLIMEINKDILKKKFKEYNSKYFGKKLKTPQFSTFISRGNTCGLCFYDEDYHKMKISIARNAIWDNDTLENIMVHEMIHLSLYQTIGHRKGKKHGKDFHKECQRLKQDFGLMITDKYPNIVLKTSQKQKTSILRRIISFFI